MEPENPFQQTHFLELSLQALMTDKTSKLAMKTKMRLLFRGEFGGIYTNIWRMTDLLNPCFSSFGTAIESLPIDKTIRFQTETCIKAFDSNIGDNFNLETFPDICTKKMRNMIFSITPTLKHTVHVESFIGRMRHLLLSADDHESIVASFAEEIITKTIKNREAANPEHLKCILGRLKKLHSELKYTNVGIPSIAEFIAKEIKDIVHDFRADSTEKESAELS